MKEIIAVDLSRLEEKGDISSSGSPMSISLGKCGRPFKHGGNLYIRTGSSYHKTDIGSEIEVNTQQVVPIESYPGKSYTYGEKSHNSHKFTDEERENFYVGMRVKHGKQEYVICEPKLTFIPTTEEDKTMKSKISIKPLFQQFLSPLDERELEFLTKSVIASGGPKEPIVLWRDPANNNQPVIIDGHNRWKISFDNNLPFNYVFEENLKDDDDVIFWMLENQMARRNLTDSQRTLYVGEYHLRLKARHAEAQEANGDKHRPGVRPAKEAAEKFGVSERTVFRAEAVARAFEDAAPEVKEKFLAGEITAKSLTNPKPAQQTSNAAAVSVIEPEPFGEYEDEETRFARETVRMLKPALTRFKDAIETARARKHPNLIIGKWTNEIYKESRSHADELLSLLLKAEDIYICAGCLARNEDGCAACAGGYVSKNTHESQMAKISDNPQWKGSLAKK